MADRFQQYIEELRRRHVIQTTGLYLFAVWGFSAGAADIFDALDMPPQAARYMIFVMFAFTPVVATLSWFFELDGSGIRLDRGVPRTRLGAQEQETHTKSQFAIGELVVSFDDRSRAFSEDFTVGRDESCDFQILDPRISREHTRFERQGNCWLIRDLGSANGTKVNGKRVQTYDISGSVKVSFYDGGPVLTMDQVVDTAASTIVDLKDLQDPSADSYRNIQHR